MAGRGWIKTDEELRRFAYANDDIMNKGGYINLMQQLNRLARHTKGGLSIKTQRQYYSHADQFIRFLADGYGSQNLANISGRHIADYLEERQADGKAASTIDLDLCAIRYFHDQFDPKATRYSIPDNSMLCKKYGITLDPRKYGGVNRRWTWAEVNRMVELAIRYGRYDVSHIIQLGSGLGLRIHEGIRLSCGDAIAALRSGKLHVKGKNGLKRDVPLRADMPQLLRAILATAPGNSDTKLFVPDGKKAHEVIQSIQAFISNYRDGVADPGARPDGVKMTAHGLRHLYAFERYREFTNEGFKPAAARLKVAMLIGHSREDITRIYLAEDKEENIDVGSGVSAGTE
ncbi:tyrosine-type recombinase/integrase [Paenibacillus agricola]|uniref:Site-specific integrase n=1 Tax=Paenibacillus agricola TaxID=2716264 RepID=A0ABX0JE88_9BACL|nr:site-specific integrase [Paenibacillus agricola]NHN33556.1 site-specific integrase [Paenibacillus agricola]